MTKDIPHHWKLTDGAAAICQWLETYKIKAQVSDAGRSTHQIIQTLDGFWGVGAIAHKGVVQLLDEMARKPISHAVQRHEFQNKINVAVGKDIWRRRTFERLIEKNAVELGYELKCSKCGSWSWHSLNRLGPVIVCELCLKTFEFPVTDPSNSGHARWSYRVIGPFALPKFADGGYAAALSIRFFGAVLSGLRGSNATWAGGHKLTFEDGREAEADFIVWFQRKQMFGTDYPTEIVFGEAKSFGKDVFKDEDVTRMKSMAERFPGSLCVFATMKESDEFSSDEIARLRKFAQWGREYDRDVRPPSVRQRRPRPLHHRRRRLHRARGRTCDGTRIGTFLITNIRRVTYLL